MAAAVDAEEEEEEEELVVAVDVGSVGRSILGSRSCGTRFPLAV